jgi:hypothetical protein
LSFANQKENLQSLLQTENRSMRTLILRVATLSLAAIALPLMLHAQAKDETSSVKVETAKTETPKPEQGIGRHRRKYH